MKTVIVVLLVLALCAGVLFGCGASAYAYRDAELYTAGPCELETDIRGLDIDWRSGTVNIRYHDEAYISVYEESDSFLSERDILRWRLDGDSLRIRFAAAGKDIFGGGKTLTILLPEGTSLRELSIDTVSADVYGEDVSAENVSIESVSGSIRVSASRDTRDFEADTVSGDVELYLSSDAAFELETDTVSGDFHTDFACTQRGNTYTCGTGGMEIDTETVSGNVSVLIAE